MNIGYARTSTADQVAGLEGQIRDLKAAGADRVFSEHISGTTVNRPQLQLVLSFLRDGDTLTVTKPDRLARSTADLLGIVKDLEARNVGLIVLSMGGQVFDSRNPASKLFLTVLAAIAEFERELTLERMKDGVAKAKAEGKYRGRQPTARAKAAEVRTLAANGVAAVEIARRTGISRRSVFRILATAPGPMERAA